MRRFEPRFRVLRRRALGRGRRPARAHDRVSAGAIRPPLKFKASRGPPGAEAVADRLRGRRREESIPRVDRRLMSAQFTRIGGRCNQQRADRPRRDRKRRRFAYLPASATPASAPFAALIEKSTRNYRAVSRMPRPRHDSGTGNLKRMPDIRFLSFPSFVGGLRDDDGCRGPALEAAGP